MKVSLWPSESVMVSALAVAVLSLDLRGDDDNHIALFEGVPGPAVALHHIRTGQFQIPIHHFAVGVRSRRDKSGRADWSIRTWSPRL